MWNKSISFPVRKTENQDSEGFSYETYEYMSGIPASFLDVTRSDETLAAQEGYNADVNVEVMACNYTGAPFLIDEENGQRYEVKRTFKKDKAMKIVLTCERRLCNGV